jgi:hypothetical protein
MPKHHTHSPSPGDSSHGHAHDSKGSRHHDHLLRQWASPSYDPTTGRAVSSVDPQGSREHVWENNRATGNAQFPDGGFKKLDAARTQNPVPVRDRKFT